MLNEPTALNLRNEVPHTCTDKCNCPIHGIKRAYNLYFKLHTCVKLGCQDVETQRMNAIIDVVFYNGYREIEEIDWYINP